MIRFIYTESIINELIQSQLNLEFLNFFSRKSHQNSVFRDEMDLTQV